MKIKRQSKFQKFLFVLITCVWGFLPFGVQSQSYYVDASAELNGDGTRDAPFRTIQAGLNAAQPGETVWVFPGEYKEPVATQRSGIAGKPITVRSYISVDAPEGSAPGWMPDNDSVRVWIRYNGRGIDITHSHIIMDGINVDGLWHSNSFIDSNGIFRDPTSGSTYPSGTNGIVRINTGTESVVLRNIEIKNNQLHLVRVHGKDILIENARIHSGISRTVNSPAPPPGIISGDDYFRDAHGIEASSANRFTVLNSYIGHVSGDCIQSGRSVWSELTVENCHFEIKPLDEPVLGLQKGTWFAEDIYDTKTPDNGQNGAKFNKGVTFRNNILNGTNYSRILHGAVLNLKEGVEGILVEGNRIFDNRMTFRLRQPTTGYIFRNNFIYDNETVFRFEGPVADVQVLNNTFHANETVVREIDSGATGSIISRNIFASSLNQMVLRAPHINWEYNLFHAVASQQGTNRILQDPLFTDAQNDDFSLLPASPALSMGLGARPWSEPYYTIWFAETNAPVSEGQKLNLSVLVINFGGVSDLQQIDLLNKEGQLIGSHENISLGSGDSIKLDFTYDVKEKFGETLEFSVKSKNDMYNFISDVLITNVADRNPISGEIILEQNYPNPFRFSTEMKFMLPKQENVRLVIYDMQGRYVTALVNEEKNAGWHYVAADLSSLRKGLYILKLQAGNNAVTRTIVKD
jgi:hypothetical protein